jgi:signal transduction histidine kinase
MGLAGLSLLGFLIGLGVLSAILLGYGLGLVFLFCPAVEHTRWLPSLRRHLAEVWSDVGIAEPYRPRPPVPEPQPDGYYHDLGMTFRTPRMPAFNRRWAWLNKDPATWRDLLWMLVDPFITGVLTAVPVVLVAYGFVALPVSLILWVDAVAAVFVQAVGLSALSPASVAWLASLLSLGVIVLGLTLARPAVRLAGWWTSFLLRPTAGARLAMRVQELTETRAEATDAQAAELRRIERDLHDGAQARLVAVGLSLGTIEALVDRDPAAAKELLGQARETAAKALADLRDLVRGIHPPVLAERGLGDAVRALALDCPLTVAVRLADGAALGRGEVGSAVAAAAYFAVAEALANATRHAGAQRVTVELSRDEAILRVTVTDDGRGGAAVAPGGGLDGIRRRLGTFDGTLTVSSPPGGPTTLTMEIPCAPSSASSSPRTSPS